MNVEKLYPNINILYIDDSIDVVLEKYLAENFSSFEKRKFSAEDTFESLFKDSLVQKANVIIIDSRLFENKNVQNKFTGEQFKMFMQLLKPFLQVIVITQNPIEYCFSIKKCQYKNDNETKKYYDSELKNLINEACENVIAYQNLLNSTSLVGYDKYFREDLKNAINGITDYQSLSKKDIDKLIEEFKKLEAKINE